MSVSKVHFFAILSVLALSACKVIAVDSTGAIPAEAIAQMGAFEGTYQGKLAETAEHTTPIASNFTLRVSHEGNRPVLDTNMDVLGQEACDSRIGRLVRLDTGGGWDVVAAFEFDAGECGDAVQGRELILRMNRSGAALLTIFKSKEAGPQSPIHNGVTTEIRARLAKSN
jgi:hypothetical protein